MRDELILLPYLLVLLWDGLYFSKDNFWDGFGNKPNWGNNEALFLIIYITFTFLFLIAIYVSYSKTKNRTLLLMYYIFIILILAVPYLMSQPENTSTNEETFIFSIFLLISTIISLYVVEREKIRDKINIFIILVLIIYLFIWFENMKNK